MRNLKIFSNLKITINPLHIKIIKFLLKITVCSKTNKSRVSLFYTCSDLIIVRLINDSWILTSAHAFNLLQYQIFLNWKTPLYTHEIIESEKGKYLSFIMKLILTSQTSWKCFRKPKGILWRITWDVCEGEPNWKCRVRTR